MRMNDDLKVGERVRIIGSGLTGEIVRRICSTHNQSWLVVRLDGQLTDQAYRSTDIQRCE
jgi:UDP-galactopyranose mutase